MSSSQDSKQLLRCVRCADEYTPLVAKHWYILGEVLPVKVRQSYDDSFVGVRV